MNFNICDLNYLNCLEEAKCVMYMDGEDEKKEHPSCDDSNISSLDKYFHIVVCYIWMEHTNTITNMKKDTNMKTNKNTRSGKVWCVIYGWGGGDALPCDSPRIQSTQLIKMRIQRQIQI